MRRLLAGIALGLAMANTAAAASLSETYQDALDQADAGSKLLDSADWQFRDGNPRQGCSLMEQARVHYETAYRDMQAMDEAVNDPAGGYSAADRDKVMSWIHQQQETLNPVAEKMATTYHDVCQQL